MRRAEDGEGINLAPVHKFTQNEASFDRFSDADIISDQKARDLQAKRHQQWNELIGSGLKGQLCGRSERTCAAPQRQAQGICQERGL